MFDAMVVIGSIVDIVLSEIDVSKARLHHQPLSLALSLFLCSGHLVVPAQVSTATPGF